MTPRTCSSKTRGARSIDSSRSSSVPGIVMARGSCAASGRFWGIAVLGDPARDALADPDAELVGRLVVELADEAAHRHRHQPAVRAQPVDADVVVLDELIQLVGDGRPDLALGGQSGQAGPQLLDRLEVGRPGRHPLVVLGVLDRGRGLGREPAEGCQLLLGPGVGPVVVDDQEPEQLGAVVERRGADRVEPFLHHRGADLHRPGIVPVACREERASSRSGLGRERRDGKVPDGLEVAGDRPRDTSAVTRPSARRRKTAARSPPNRTRAWSTTPARICSRSSLLPMSVAMRRNASARWSWVDVSARRRSVCTATPS